MNLLRALIHRDVRLAWRAGGGAGLGVAFFILASLLFAFAVGAERSLLSRLAPPIIWTAMLLSALIGLDRIFETDAEDGGLDDLAQAAPSLSFIVLAKAAAYFLTAGAPILIAAPAMALLLNLPSESFSALMASLLIGAPGLCLMATLCAALTFGLRRADALAFLLAAPLLTPFLIFGVGAAAIDGVSERMLLAAATLFALILTPLAGAAALRFNLE